MVVLLNKIRSWFLGSGPLKLKKSKASTLIEVLVASVIIIVVFAIASMTLNNVFKSVIKNDNHAIDSQLNKLLYLYQHDKIDNEYQGAFQDWDITFSLQTENNTVFVVAEAVQKNKIDTGQYSGKTITKKLIYEGAE